MSKVGTKVGRWYRNSRWARRAAAQLKRHPLCKMCLDKSIVTPATVADHIIPHRGDPYLFWYGDLQSLCHQHHSGAKAVEEKRGYSDEIGLDGWPTDRKHPANR